MAVRDPAGDPRVGAAPPPPEAQEAGVRPTVALPRGGPSGLAFGIGALVAGAILFSVLNARRQSLTGPAVRQRAADATQTGTPPPPLYIPPPPAPPPPVEVVEKAAPPPPPRPVPPPPPPQIVYVPQPAPAVVNQPPPPPPRNPGGAALVVDTTTAAPSVQAAPAGGQANGGNGLLGSTVSSGGRVRASVFANRSQTVAEGTLIPAVLETAFDSTRPGLARAIVSRDIRGFDGTRILVPRGSRLIGDYRSDVANGQKRALITWNRLIRPDGTTIAIDSPAADTLGRGGISGHYNSHFWERFGGAILQTVLDIGANVGTRAVSGNNVIILPTTNNSSAAFASLLPQNRIVPTLTVPAGTSISIFVAHDLDFSGSEARK